ncbi:hypothetical protein QEZ54_08690 [Catellatospora sp. KI3]|uniref:hypothetical protein n=1 Tax=Catellatospora sp. KI3 TaxID=3041620 RepID=UPI002482D698|nr:hypothetical protein [Catellatospora sp. KI3]MDI1461039.1 hypothetical protein [Catellatospora sp. KI3]
MIVDGPAMPGEAEPLRYERGRGPLANDEVLANMRRRQRIKNAKVPADQHEDLTDRLPDIHGSKDPIALRLPTLLVEYLHLVALIEDLPLTAVFEAALMEKALSAPLRPDRAKERYFELADAMNVGRSHRGDSVSGLDLSRIREKAADLLAAIDELHGSDATVSSHRPDAAG